MFSTVRCRKSKVCGTKIPFLTVESCVPSSLRRFVFRIRRFGNLIRLYPVCLYMLESYYLFTVLLSHTPLPHLFVIRSILSPALRSSPCVSPATRSAAVLRSKGALRVLGSFNHPTVAAPIIPEVLDLDADDSEHWNPGPA